MDKQQILNEVAEKLKGQELFPESNARAKEFLSRAKFVSTSGDAELDAAPKDDADREANEKID